MMDEVKHKGFVSSVNRDRLYLTIVNQAACAECHAKSACTVSEFKEKEIEVTSFRKDYKEGQAVTVVLHESSGVKAVVLAYVIPFVIILVSLIIAITISGNEILSGFAALGMLIPYFAVLWLFRGKLKKTFRFELEE